MKPQDIRPADSGTAIATRSLWIALAVLVLSAAIGVGVILWGNPDLARELWPAHEPGARQLP